MLRSLPRASSSSASLLNTTTTRHALKPFRYSPIACLHAGQQQRSRQAHAISNPTLAGIEKRWEAMPPQEQADLWMSLRDRMKADWHELTMQEKKAGTSRTRDASGEANGNHCARCRTSGPTTGHCLLPSFQAVPCYVSRPRLTRNTYSILDRLRPPRAPRPPSSRRRPENLRLHHDRRWRLICLDVVCANIRRRATRDDDERVPRADE